MKEKQAAKKIAVFATIACFATGAFIAYFGSGDSEDFLWDLIYYAWRIFYIFGFGAVIGAYLTGEKSPGMSYCMKIGYGVTLGSIAAGKAVGFLLNVDESGADVYGVGIVVSVLICTIIWNSKFVSMNYISNEIYEKNIKLTEDMYRPTFDRKLDKYLDLFAIRKPCEVTGEIVNVYFHPFNDNGKPMLKFNGCGMRSYCKECDLCADRAFDTVEKLNRKETTFEKTGAFSVKQ